MQPRFNEPCPPDSTIVNSLQSYADARLARVQNKPAYSVSDSEYTTFWRKTQFDYCDNNLLKFTPQPRCKPNTDFLYLTIQCHHIRELSEFHLFTTLVPTQLIEAIALTSKQANPATA
jgi:hypothetical protein